MSCQLGTTAGLGSEARTCKARAAEALDPCLPVPPCSDHLGGQGTQHGRGLCSRLALALLGISLGLAMPANTMGASATLGSDGAEKTSSQKTNHYTGTITPSNTATLTSERPLFSAFATASLPFGGLIHQDCVLTVARSAAYLEALHEVALSLNKHTAANIGAYEVPRRMALAMSAYSPTVSRSVTGLPAPEAGKGSPHASAKQADELLTVLVTLEAPLHILDTRLRQTMQHPDTWELYAAVLQQMQNSVQEGRELITRAANLRSDHGAHMDAAFMSRTTYLADQLDALWMYIRILPKLRTLWDNPILVQKQMQRALTLAPRHPLLWCALGEAQLQMDLPQKALDSLNTALKFAPDLARALYARGVAHLRLQQSALAENDLTAALKLQPQTVHWLRARGAVRMVREEYGPMCEDFLAACALGDCDGLITARKRDLCRPAPNSAPTPTPTLPPRP